MKLLCSAAAVAGVLVASIALAQDSSRPNAQQRVNAPIRAQRSPNIPAIASSSTPEQPATASTLGFTPVKVETPTDYGAYCDGAHDDTKALQAWLDQARPYAKLALPAGRCLFSSSLSIGDASQYTIEGQGNFASILVYTGTDSNVDLLTINAPAKRRVVGITLRSFGMIANTRMTGGYAIRANGLHGAILDDIALSGIDGSLGNGNFCGGVYFYGAASVSVRNPIMRSSQECGDAIRVVGILGGFAEIQITGGTIGGDIVRGFPKGWLTGLHMAGAYGGVRCDNTNFHNNVVGWLVDDADVNGTTITAGNREWMIGSTCALDGMRDAGLVINDPLSNGGGAPVRGWVASSRTGAGIDVKSLPNGILLINDNRLYNNCGSGLLVEDPTTNVIIGAGEGINKNGRVLGRECKMWQAANPGHGYGIEATVPTTRIINQATPLDNAAGPWNENTHLGGPFVVYNSGKYTAGTIKDTNGHPAYLVIDGSNAAGVIFESKGSNKWQVGADAANNFEVLEGESAPDAFRIQAGGDATLGEGPGNVTTFNGVGIFGAFTVATLPRCDATHLGAHATVTDGQTGPVYLEPVRATGSTVAPVFCNGSAWVYGG